MNIFEAITAAVAGKYIRRAGWPETTLLYHEGDFEFEVTREGCRPAIGKGTLVKQDQQMMMLDALTNQLRVYAFTTSDVFALDWIAV